MASKSKGPIKRAASQFVRPIRRAVRHGRRLLFDPMYPAYRRWLADDGDRTLRFDYPLTSESLVFDIGGFEGAWTAAIVERYGCRVHVFEPVPKFADALSERFSKLPLVRVFDFGLADKDEELEIALEGDASSIYRGDGDSVVAKFRDVVGYLDEQRITCVDLAKINIEGGEYPLIETLIDKERIEAFVRLQVQFHTFADNAVARRSDLVRRLSNSHRPTWSYPFVWENWVRLDNDGVNSGG